MYSVDFVEHIFKTSVMNLLYSELNLPSASRSIKSHSVRPWSGLWGTKPEKENNLFKTEMFLRLDYSRASFLDSIASLQRK